MPATPDAVVRAWFEELWNQGKEETIERLFAADGIVHGLSGTDGPPMRGPEAFRPFFKTFHAAFPNIRVEVTQTVTEGSMVSALCHVTGTHQGNELGIPATMKEIDIWGMCLARVSEGRIVEGWNCFDFLALYQQIGALPRL